MKSFLLILSISTLSVLLVMSCGSEPIELSDYDWRVTQLAGTSASKAKLENLTLEFKEDQAIGGFAGCGEFRGGATYNQQQIKFSTLYTDQTSCEDAALERVYLKNLENSSQYVYNANKLIIQDESGNILVEMEKI
ncbi:MAG: META domain-containing protein [Lunatimonas sp.]|uniref:META domain-containing protein n=1 Tax=Lunatimonas sp. TaxID=2060141 RepID=UPI00263B5C41|nr:META domain-containing protein [Lunatimonas sp.]MCC5939599.1 META domain-containing protein [Lunatimonas sp.]